MFVSSDVSSSVGVLVGCSTTTSAAWASLLTSSVPSAHVSTRAGRDSTTTWPALTAPIPPKRSRYRERVGSVHDGDVVGADITLIPVFVA